MAALVCMDRECNIRWVKVDDIGFFGGDILILWRNKRKGKNKGMGFSIPFLKKRWWKVYVITNESQIEWLVE